jgi:hypothetical protein
MEEHAVHGDADLSIGIVENLWAFTSTVRNRIRGIELVRQLGAVTTLH